VQNSLCRICDLHTDSIKSSVNVAKSKLVIDIITLDETNVEASVIKIEIMATQFVSHRPHYGNADDSLGNYRLHFLH